MANPRLLLVASCVVLLLAGFYALLEALLLQYEDTEYYPDYSTYQTGPTGTRALYAALGNSAGVPVERNRLPIETFNPPTASTVFLVGTSVSPDPLKALEKFEAFADAGGRLVIAHGPCRDAGNGYCFSDIAEKIDGEVEGEEDEIPEFARMIYAGERWGFDYEVEEFEEPTRNAMLRGAGEEAAVGSALPATLTWGSALYFDKLAPEWKVLYGLEGNAVLIERPWGKGSIVLSSDSYFLSNEAMKKDRHPELLAWLVGPAANIVFDEAHLGLGSSPGIMDLIYRLRLEGVLAVFVLLALLAAWMGLASPAPRREATLEELQPRSQGREAMAGLVSLLRRSVPPGQLIDRCRIEWERAAPLLGARGRSSAEAVAQAARAHDYAADPQRIIDTYRNISRQTQEKR